MKKFKIHFLAILFLGLSLTSCDHDHDEENKITIKIEEPTSGATISKDNCGDVHVHIDITGTSELHDVEIALHPEGDEDNKIIDYDKHSHENSLDFEQEVDLCSFAAGTCFHLEVAVCKDHECSEKETSDAEFCLE